MYKKVNKNKVLHKHGLALIKFNKLFVKTQILQTLRLIIVYQNN